MAGHSHWARIKRAKAVTDARRGRQWSKLSRAIILAARNGADPDANLALRYAIDAARDANMPRDTIERNIKKGSGELGDQQFEELLYEGYGPGGAAILVAAMTDNRHRTSGEVRNILENKGGNLGATNCVAWMFAKRGQFLIAADKTDEDTLTNLALESGAEDVKRDGDTFELTCEQAVFETVRQALKNANIATDSAQITMIPSTWVTLEGEKAEQMVRLIDALEEHDDVQHVYSNFELSEADMNRLA